MAGATGGTSVAGLAKPSAPKRRMPKSLYCFCIFVGRQRPGFTRIFYRLTRSFKIILRIYTSLIHTQRFLILKTKQNKQPTPKENKHKKKPAPVSWQEFNTFAGLIQFLRSPVSTQNSKLKLDQIHSSQYNVNEFRRYIA